ncbi:hypothetical protein [Anaeromyxobacter oryzae]|uniref:Glycosyltransferase n=1 Tax=Anaeromyxobacter oryzae TaxID=2918170 RepID=A0ABN6MY02_9BACT|nr:hypothetical protein [Anaeromyxobacter oryzae]BDG05825.1 hypothetical protein AMOR_48210 [Anaeromyxobacter oryzae]
MNERPPIDAIRARLARLLGLSRGPPRPLDAIVTHVEVNERHGVGVLLRTLFGDGTGVVTIRSRDDYDGRQDFGALAVRVSHRRGRSRAAVRRRVARALRGVEVRRVLCVPYYPDDVLTALALHDAHAAPLVTWIMDDQNLLEPSIPDDLVAELLAKSAVAFAISPELRDAYAEKYRRPVWFAPPLVAADRVRPPGGEDVPATGRPMVIGNIWGARWYQDLRRTVRGTGIRLDWSSPAGLSTFWAGFDREALAADGVEAVGALPEPVFVERLRAAPYVVVPSGTLDEADDRPGISRFSLPSRIVFAVAAAHAPVVVLGSPRTAAARFVSAHGLGAVVPYDPAAFRAAVAELSTPEAQRGVRLRAAAIAGRFSAEGVLEWLWRSLEAGAPADDRFERLAPAAPPGPGRT